jgi:hypothetical protein
MCRRRRAPSVPVVTDDEHRQRRRATLGAVAGLILAALVVVRLVVHRLLGLDLPDVDVPGWLRWAGPVLGVGKLLFLVGLGVLAVLGEWERRRRQGSGRESR